MQFYLLMPLWIKMTEKIKPFTAIAVSLSVMLIAKQYIPQLLSGFEKISSYNDRIFTTYLVYWTAGCYVGINYKKVCSYLEKSLIPFAVLFIATASADIVFSYKTFVYGKYFAFLENLHMVYCISAIMFLFSLFTRIRNIPFADKLSSVSFNVYLFHCLVIFIFNDFMARLGITSITALFFIRMVAAYGITFALCLMYQNIKAKIKSRV